MKQKTLRELVFELVGEFRGMKNEMRKMNGTLINHEKRINSNETKRDIMTGKATVIGAVTGAIFGFIGAGVIAFFTFFWDK